MSAVSSVPPPVVTLLSSFAPASLAMKMRESGDGAACNAASGASSKAKKSNKVGFMIDGDLSYAGLVSYCGC